MSTETVPGVALADIKREVDALHAFLSAPPFDDDLKWEQFLKAKQTALNQAMDKHLDRLWLPNSVGILLKEIKRIADSATAAPVPWEDSHRQLNYIWGLVSSILDRNEGKRE